PAGHRPESRGPGQAAARQGPQDSGGQPPGPGPAGPAPVRKGNHHRRGIHGASGGRGRTAMRGRSGFGWSQFLMGVCLILLGVFTFLQPRSMFTGIAVLYGIAAVITGICDIVIYIKAERFTGFGPAVSLISGILSIM